MREKEEDWEEKSDNIQIRIMKNDDGDNPYECDTYRANAHWKYNMTQTSGPAVSDFSLYKWNEMKCVHCIYGMESTKHSETTALQ